jgi:hypothetical protein
MSGSSTRERALDPNRVKAAVVLVIAGLLLGARVVKTADEKLASLTSPRERERVKGGLVALLRFDEEPAFVRRLGKRFAAFDAVRRHVPSGGRLGIVCAADPRAAWELARDLEYLRYPLPVADVPDWEQAWEVLQASLDAGAWVLVLDPAEPLAHAERFELVAKDESFALYRFAETP